MADKKPETHEWEKSDEMCFALCYTASCDHCYAMMVSLFGFRLYAEINTALDSYVPDWHRKCPPCEPRECDDE